VPDDPVNTIQVYVGQLRRVLEPLRAPRQPAEVLVSVPPGYELVVDTDHLDALAFEALLATGRDALVAGDVDRGGSTLRAALGLWRGDALPEFADAEFARTQLTRLRELRLTALEDRIEADLALGAHGQVVGELETLTTEHPFRERLWELRMVALYRGGRPADALRAYQEARRILGEELGLDPGPKLRDLDREIAQRDPNLELDRRRPLATPASEPRRTAIEPSERFVGRRAELSRLEELLERAIAGDRVVAVITAEAGAGKTRLVAELAALAWGRGCIVASGRCFEAESGPPFAPVLECLSELARATDPVALRRDAERAAAIVARLLPDLHELLGELPEPGALPAEEDRVRLFDAVARLVVLAVTFEQKEEQPASLALCLDASRQPPRPVEPHGLRSP